MRLIDVGPAEADLVGTSKDALGNVKERSSNIFVVSLRNRMNGGIFVEAVWPVAEFALNPRALQLRHRYNQELRCAYYFQPRGVSLEQAGRNLDSLTEAELLLLYRSGMNLG
jgi:hypothetical protein